MACNPPKPEGTPYRPINAPENPEIPQSRTGLSPVPRPHYLPPPSTRRMPRGHSAESGRGRFHEDDHCDPNCPVCYPDHASVVRRLRESESNLAKALHSNRILRNLLVQEQEKEIRIVRTRVRVHFFQRVLAWGCAGGIFILGLVMGLTLHVK